MSSIINQYSRMSHHTITDGVTFSVPTQEDFTIKGTTNSWTQYDLALSEIGVDELGQRVFIRIGGTVSEISLGGTSSSETLAETLISGNKTDGNHIEMSVGDRVNSPSGNSYLQITDTDVKVVGNDDITIQSLNGIAMLKSPTSSVVAFNGITFQNPGADNYTFPLGDGLTGQYMETDGLGQFGWVTPSPYIFTSATVSTTNNTPVTILSDTIPSDTIRFYKCNITGIISNFTKGYYGYITASVRNRGGIVSIFGLDINEKTEFTTAKSTIDISGTTVRVRITGEAATTIHWESTLEHN